MAAITLDGKAALDAIKEELRVRVKGLSQAGHAPGLGTVLVGDDPDAALIVDGKHRDCAEVGILSMRRDLPATAGQAEIEAAVVELNSEVGCSGVSVQLPLPVGRDALRVLERVNPGKDADGLHPVSLGRLMLNAAAPIPCIPRAIIELLRRYEVPIAGANVVVIGRGTTVGRPLSLLLTRRTENATVTQCHTGTRNLAEQTLGADIVIAAAGVPYLLTPDMVRPGAAVLDVGVTRVDGRLVGDIHPDVREVAGYFAPNPGGVGPMTPAMLLTNVVELAERG